MFWSQRLKNHRGFESLSPIQNKNKNKKDKRIHFGKCKIRRALKVKLDGTDIVLELSKATAIKGKSKMIHFDELDDGTWRLIFSKDMIDDFSKIKSFEIIREDE